MTEPQIEAGSSQTAQIETEHQISLSLEINSLILHVTKNLNYRNTDPRPGLHFSQGEAAAWADPHSQLWLQIKLNPHGEAARVFAPSSSSSEQHIHGDRWVLSTFPQMTAACGSWHPPALTPPGAPHRRCRSCCPPTADGRLEEDGAAHPATGSSLQSQPGEGRRAPSELSQRRQQPGLCAPFALSL